MPISRKNLNKIVEDGTLKVQKYGANKYYPGEEFFKEIESQALTELGVRLTHPLEIDIKRDEQYIEDTRQKLKNAKQRLWSRKVELESMQGDI